MKETISSNLIRYRKGLHISQQSLAEQTGVTRQTINNYEKGKTLPDSKTLSLLARSLGVTLDDILRPIDQLPKTNNFCFRTHCKFTQKPQFTSYVNNLLNIYTALEVAVGLPPYAPETTPCNVLEGNENRIQQIAKSFRLRLGIGDAPIPNLFEAVEELGLKVLRLPIEQKDFFGLSACSNSQGAFVLINTHNISIERQIFTLAHEIGHLIFHRDEYQNQLMISESREEEKAKEKVANYFASHLLVSQTAFDLAHQNMTDLLELKAHFRVSYTMILKRFDELGVIDYGKFIIKIRSDYKRRNKESLTNDIELEPKLAEKHFPVNQRYQTLIWKALKGEKISESKAAELLNITIEALRLARIQQEVYEIA